MVSKVWLVGVLKTPEKLANKRVLTYLITCNLDMNLNKEQLNDVTHAVAYYMYHHVSITNPRYNEYEVILQLLRDTKEETKWLQ